LYLLNRSLNLAGLGSVKELYRVPYVPTSYFVDRTGVIRAKFEGAFSAAELERAVAGARQ